MNLNDLEDPNALDAAVADALAVLCQGLPGQPAHAKPIPISREPRVSERLRSLLRRAREAQAAIVTRTYTRGLLAVAADFNEPRPRAPYEIGRLAATELVVQLQRTGRALQGRREIGHVGTADEALLQLLTALAGVGEEDAQSRRRLRTLMDTGGRPQHLGPFLARFVELVPHAAETREGLDYAADALVPALLPEVEVLLAAETSVADEPAVASAVIAPRELIAHTLRAGARRLAFLSGQRTRP
jgi:hypothetical protein